ncbi:Uncharacterised protein [Vibrio cholerae]|nr:Uncharacterised protein [Vibrio cholerae]
MGFIEIEFGFAIERNTVHIILHHHIINIAQTFRIG